jgi:hypothetical protein
MFDRVTVQNPTQYVTKEVIEHRAPTDESVKLLREMEAAAQAEVIKALKIEGNGFTAHVDMLKDISQPYLLIARAVYDLNGTRHVVKVDVDYYNDAEGSDAKRKLFTKLRDKIAEQIATEALMPAFAEYFSGGGRYI